MGQIAGSVESRFWNTDEHIAALLRSSVAINALPALEGVCPENLHSHDFIYNADIDVDTLLASSQCCRFRSLRYFALECANNTNGNWKQSTHRAIIAFPYLSPRKPCSVAVGRCIKRTGFAIARECR